MLHERFDTPYWTQRFTLQRLRNEARAFCEERRQENPAAYPSQQAFESHVQLMSPKAEIIDSPASVVILEQLRHEFFGSSTPEMISATDVFIWSLGPATNPAITRIGAIPLLSRTIPWPQNARGRPLSFFAQLCFADSLELVPRLPGDLLLIFRDLDIKEYFDGTYFALWSNTRLTDPIDSLPEGATELFVPCYAQIHRTWSGVCDPRSLGKFQATAIGTEPFIIQTRVGNREANRCIATISAINLWSRHSPFVNVETVSKELRKELRHRLPLFGDVGCLYILFDNNTQSVSFETQTH